MWLYSMSPNEPEDKTVINNHSAKGLESVVKSLERAIWTADNKVRGDMMCQMI